MGRDMDCEKVRRRLSDGDGRILRRRDIRSHLRGCSSCRDFRAAIGTRRSEFAFLSPLPAGASALLLKSILGGGQAGSGAGTLTAAVGGGAGKAIVTSATLKSAAAALAVATVGVAGADVAGVVHIAPFDRGSGKSAPASLPGSPISHGPAIPAGAGASSAVLQGSECSTPAQRPARWRVERTPARGTTVPPRRPIIPMPGAGGAAAGGQSGNAAVPGSGSQKSLPGAAANGQQNAAANRPTGLPPQVQGTLPFEQGLWCRQCLGFRVIALELPRQLESGRDPRLGRRGASCPPAAPRSSGDPCRLAPRPPGPSATPGASRTPRAITAMATEFRGLR